MDTITVIFIFLFLVLGLPGLWLVSELKNSNKKDRISFGILALISTVLITGAFGLIDRLNYSTNYAAISKHLVGATISQLEKGNTVLVLSSFKELQSQFKIREGAPIDRYDQLVKEAVSKMEKNK